MTEPNPEKRPETDPAPGTDLETDPATAEAGVDWPSLRDGSAAQESARDAAVDVLLERLGALPSTPVSLHGGIYGTLHDDLMAALNEDATGQPSQRGTQHDGQA